MGQPLLEIKRLSKCYEERPILEDISLSVQKGEVIEEARALLARVGLSDKEKSFPRQLSGGNIVEESSPKEFFEQQKTDRAKKFLNVFRYEDD